MDTFHLRLTASLEYPVKRIPLGHITTVQDVLKLRDELVVRIDVEMHGAADESL
ncbi:hypothetical protein [Pseudomonas marginalis]|uniref:hypothetical protein n=1 Tax=Pseudomonas marginalis TaxID=298 RepID=UPI002A35F149|nr:hypothetical protein [Pseudomonas marginalis]WPN22282.1 hypothetical protein QMK57_23180 [Pseudomonas marginalis]